MPATEVVRLVNKIANLKLSESEWQFDKQPYTPAHSPPAVSFSTLGLFFVRRVLLCRLTSRP